MTGLAAGLAGTLLLLLSHTLAAALVCQIFFAVFFNVAFQVPMNAIFDKTRPEKRSLAYSSFNMLNLFFIGLFSFSGAIVAKWLSVEAALWASAACFTLLGIIALRIREPKQEPVAETQP